MKMSMNILYKVIAFVCRHTRLYIFVNEKRNCFFNCNHILASMNPTIHKLIKGNHLWGSNNIIDQKCYQMDYPILVFMPHLVYWPNFHGRHSFLAHVNLTLLRRYENVFFC